jgi:DNA-binding LacI/PurR family transcriptional regulator
MTTTKSFFSTPYDQPAQQAVLDSLRTEIVTGKYPPGSRLPTRTELERRFNVSRVTIQRVFDRLSRDGFVRPRQRHGTFVTQNPPHLTTLGLIFPWRKDDGQNPWPHFWTNLIDAAAESPLRQDAPSQLEVFTGIREHSDLDQYHRLVESLDSHRLAGLIFANRPYYFDQLRSLVGRVPCVAIMSRADIPGVHALKLDNELFIERALDHLASRGRRKLAVIMLPGERGPAELRSRLHQRAASRGMTIEPFWVQMVPAAAAANVAHLLFHPGQHTRPDALFITDDNLVEQTTAGLTSAGVQPADVDVLAHTNFPEPTPACFPVRRLGFDARAVLDAAVSIITDCREGRDAPQVVTLDPLFEEEVSPAV